jgi:uncharacterized protein (DUF2267 family)
MDAGDYEQDLVLDLWRRQDAFDASRASFRTFADRIVAHRAATLASRTAKALMERGMASLDAPLAGDDGATLAEILSARPEGHSQYEEQDLVFDVRRFVSRLTPALKRCCEILVSGNVAEATEVAGLHRSTVYESACRLRMQATEAGLGAYVLAPRHTALEAGK